MSNAYYELLRPAPNSTVFNDELADFWLDEEGFLCSVAKNVNRTVEKQKASFALIRKMIGDQKVCYLSDANNTGVQDQESRKHMNSEITNFFKAMAISVNTPMGQLVVNTFLTFSHQPIPMRMFDNPMDARVWLRQYL